MSTSKLRFAIFVSISEISVIYTESLELLSLTALAITLYSPSNFDSFILLEKSAIEIASILSLTLLRGKAI